MDRKFKKQKSSNKNAQLQLDPPLLPPLDILSSLPDAILVDILSLLPTKTAITTSVLSHRWRFLWTQSTSLRLNCRHFPQQSSEFYTVVDQLLARLTSPFLHTFSIHAPYPRQSRHQHFEPWLPHVCSLNVQTIDITVDSRDGLTDVIKNSPFELPHCIFQTQSLVCLNLPSRGLEYIFPDGDDTHFVIELPNLIKLSLSLTLCASQCGFVANLVRSCPLLEDLTLTAISSWITLARTNNSSSALIIDISCRTLKHFELTFFSVIRNAKVVIDAPKLDCLALYAFSLSSCCFVDKPITLRELLIDFYDQSQDLLLSLLPGISNVTVLDIPGKNFSMFEGCKDDQGNSLAFSNLIELRLQFKGESGDGLGGFSFESTSPSLLLWIKIIKITIRKVKHGNNFNKLAEYLLSNAPSLEKLTFLVGPHSSQTVGMLSINLDLFSRKFPHCLIEICGHYACV